MRLTAILCMVFFGSATISEALNLGQVGSFLSKLPKPTATLDKFDIKQISLRDITFSFDIGIHNPYVIDLTLDGVDLDFSVEGNRVFHTTTVQGASLKAGEKTMTSFDVTLTYEDIIKLIQDYHNRDYLACDTDVLVKIPIPKTLKGLPPTVDIPFKLSQQIPAVNPTIGIANFKVTMPTVADVRKSLEDSMEGGIRNLDANEVLDMFGALVAGKSAPTSVVKPADIDLKFKVAFDIVLQNKTKAPLDFTSLQFDFLVNAEELVKGTTTQVDRAGDTTILRVINEFSSKSLTAAVLDAFKTGEGTFTLSGATSIQLPPEILAHPLQLSFKEDGNFKLR